LFTFTTLASGSTGNAALVSCGDTHILLDAGISAKRITAGLAELGVKPHQAARRFRTNLPARFENDPGPCRLSGVLLEIDNETFHTTAIQRINIE